MARKPIVIEKKSSDKKRNPNSLRGLIADVVNEFYSSNKTRAVSGIRKSGKNKYIAAPTGWKEFNEKALTEIIDDETYITYWHVEAVAHSVDIPAGVFLLFSRMLSNADKEKESESLKEKQKYRDENWYLIKGLRAIVDSYNPDETVDIKLFKQWVELFRESQDRLL